MKNLILCILLIGTLCATIGADVLSVRAEESAPSSGLTVADDLVDAIPVADESTTEGETSIIKDVPSSGEVEQASPDEEATSAADDEESIGGTEELNEEADLPEEEPDYYKKNSDNEITITAELDEPDGELKVADPKTLVEAPRISDPYDQYDTIGDGVNYLVTIPKRLGFIEKDDGSYESDGAFTVWSNLNDDQTMTVNVSGGATSNVILRDHRGTGEAVREVIPYIVDLNWDATKSYGDRIIASGSRVSICGSGEFTARSKLVAADGEGIGAGRWAGPMVFSVDISPQLTEEQQEAAAEYAAEHPEYD